MAKFISAVILMIMTTCCLFNVSNGYKWVSVKPGSPLPKNTILFGNNKSAVGRAAHYNLIQPVEVFNSSYAVATIRNEKLIKKVFEVLVASEKCKWIEFYNYNNISTNVVRVGRTWNREPIYLGRSIDAPEINILPILMTSKPAMHQYYKQYLACDDNTTWVDATPYNFPKNAIKANKSNSIVARLMGPSTYISATIQNKSKFCSTVHNKTKINSISCQVLVGNVKEYSWKSTGDFECIPDNAVVVGRTEKDEFIYVYAGPFGDISDAIFSELVHKTFKYEILVKN